MEIDQETQKQIQELQILEQNLQNIMMQKQALQLEVTEVENALTELKKAGKEVYKITGQIMIAADKDDLEKELKQKKDLVSLRLKSLDKQEEGLASSSEKLRKEVLGKVQK